ncbi:MAG: NADH-quinone oxidoreductase subunit J family protein [Planctomycetota bacterium]|jgi:NADH-quinone oxidoreductase subunit J
MLEALLFYLFAAMAVVGGLMAALLPRIVHAVFSLLLCFLGVTGIYLLAGADFLAITQLVVYVGGVMVLLAFGILLTGRTAEALGEKEARPRHRLPGVLLGLVLFAGLLAAVMASEFEVAGQEPSEGTISGIGRLLLGEYIILFEFASILLLMALVGAAYLVRRERA